VSTDGEDRLHENGRAWLLEKLRGPDVGAPEHSVALVARLCDAYADHGLFDGDIARPLDCDCPAAEACWADVPDKARPLREMASISVPWLGPRYRPGGIAAVGINQNDYGGLGALWWIRRGANANLRSGKRKNFDIGAGSYLALAHASRAGQPLEADVRPEQAADAWDASAFLEAIKCAPRWASSKPTDAMWQNCPHRYLLDELTLIAPGALVVIGRTVGPAVTSLLEIEVSERETEFWRGWGSLNGRPLDVLCCDHPSHRRWIDSLPRLRSSLERRPIEVLRAAQLIDERRHLSDDARE
jgi:hypothetical protein